MANEKKAFQRFFLVILSSFLVLEAGMVLFTVIVDPFYQYHKPWMGMPVILDNAVYQTPGAARNLDYRDAIVGTSMTENFHTSWFDEELGWNTMKLSYSGARSDDLKAILSQIFSREEPVDHIFMDMNDYQLTCPSQTAYAERPAHLYTDWFWDDFDYVCNREVAVTAWTRVLNILDGACENVDTAYTWEDPALFGSDKALAEAETLRMQLSDSPETAPETEDLQEMLHVCQENLDNITPFIQENPDTEFIIYLPPYSILYWEHKTLIGKLETMLRIYQHAICQLLEYPNVTMYFFMDERELITDLNHYRDVTHHIPLYNRYIFDCIKNGEKQITLENQVQLLQDMYEFVRDYDYDIYWREF